MPFINRFRHHLVVENDNIPNHFGYPFSSQDFVVVVESHPIYITVFVAKKFVCMWKLSSKYEQRVYLFYFFNSRFLGSLIMSLASGYFYFLYQGGQFDDIGDKSAMERTGRSKVRIQLWTIFHGCHYNDGPFTRFTKKLN